jgi:hypothetical protein
MAGLAVAVLSASLNFTKVALIYQRAVSQDQILILGTKEAATQPFSVPPGWLDLRIGMFLSLTSTGDNDTPTGLAETIIGASAPVFDPSQWMWIGVKDSGPLLPGAAGTEQFIGWSNAHANFLPLLGSGNSVLSSSDLGIGTTNAYYWLPNNSQDLTQCFVVEDRGSFRASGVDGIQPHFFQAFDPGNLVPGDYYCGMLGFRMLRSTSNSLVVTIEVPTTGAHSADMFWTDAPTQAQLHTLLDPWPTTVQTIGPITLSFVPDSLFAFWPFALSRLRISSWGILAAA